MAERIDLVDRLRVTSPCAESWGTMSGNDRVRFCGHCSKDVHNLSGMTREQAAALVSQSGGKLCVRYARAGDGSALFAPAPFRLRAAGRRVSFVLSAAFAALLGLFGGASAQQATTSKTESWPDGSQATFRRSRLPQGARGRQAVISGKLLDPTGADIPGARITLVSKRDKHRLTATTDEEGRYSFPAVSEGVYLMTVRASGFKELKVKDLKVVAGEDVEIDVSLPVGTVMVGVVVIAEPSTPKYPLEQNLLNIPHNPGPPKRN